MIGRMTDRTRIVTSGLLLGLGLGGFFDGIVFHQLLGWHHMICTTDTCKPHTVAELEWQNFTDGLFHAACWVLCIAGLGVLSSGDRLERFARPFFGWMTAGWGIFNVVEGLIDHIILGIHHVRPGPSQGAWDIGFLVWGALFTALGWIIARRRRDAPTPAGAAEHTTS